MQNSDKGLPRISLAGCGHMLITLDTMVYFHQIVHTYTVLHCLDTGMQNNGEAFLSISLAGHGQLVKMFNS